MADSKISGLPSASPLGGTEELPIVQSASTLKTTIDAIKTYFTGFFESLSNKATTWSVINDTLYPTVKNVDTQIKGVITSSLSFFFYKTASDIGTYYKMLQTPSTGIAQSFVKLNTSGTTTIVKFITEPTLPNKLYIPIGWNRIHVHAEKTGAGNVTLFAKIFKRDSGGTETVLFTTSTTLTNLTTSNLPYDLEYYNTGIVPILATDRIGVEILSVTSTGTPDVTVWVEDSFLSRVDLPTAANDLTGYELIANKQNSLTVDGTGTKYVTVDAINAGVIKGTVGTTATFGAPIPYNSSVANTVTSSPFWSLYNSAGITKQVLANTSTSQQQGYMFEENGQYAGFYRYGSAFSASQFTGTSVAKGNTISLESANSVNLPIIILGSPIIQGIGQTSTNVAIRHDATGWRQGTMADVHTANTVAFEVGGIAKFGSVITLKNYTVATLPTGVRGYECYVTDALAPTYLGIAVGGGAIICKVFFNGTNWIT